MIVSVLGREGVLKITPRRLKTTKNKQTLTFTEQSLVLQPLFFTQLIGKKYTRFFTGCLALRRTVPEVMKAQRPTMAMRCIDDLSLNR